MRQTLLVGLLALALAGGARAAGGGSVSASVVANPLAVALSLSPASVTVGSPVVATASVSNLGTASLTNVGVTLQADSGIGGASTKRLASLAGGATATVTWQLCAVASGAYILVAKGATPILSAESTGQLLQVSSGGAQCPESASAILAAGGTLTTDGEGDGATASDPIETTIISPVAGTVSIDERQSTVGAPAGLTILGWQVQISAPASSAGTPLRFTFEFDASHLAGLDPLTIQVSRNGLVVSDCTGTSGTASPDPCVARRALRSDGDLEFVVLTSAASTWTFGTIYPFAGFFQPVDNLPTLNAMQAGKSVPVKFALGADRGLGILAAGYPAPQRIACGSSAPVDAVEQTVSASSSSLTYDAATAQYVYIWKTDKAWAGSCRELVIRLVDGTEHRARFQLR